MVRSPKPVFLAFQLVALLVLVLACSAAPTPAPTAVPAKPTAEPTKAAAPAPTSAVAAAPTAASAAPTASAAAKPAPLSPPVKVKVMSVAAVSDGGLFIADEKGYFKEEGVDIEFNILSSTPDVYGPLATGQVDVAGSGPNSGFFNAMQRDIPVRIVADKGNVAPGFGFLSMVVRKDLMDSGAVKTVADLKGKTIAHPANGVGVDIDLDRILAKGSLTRKDINIQMIPFPNMNAAYANKGVDAGIQQEPLLTAGVAQGLFKPLIGLDETFPNHEIATLLYSPLFIKNNPEAAKRFMVAYVRGLRDYNDAFSKGKNKADIVAIMAKRTTVKDVALYDKMTMAGLNPDGYANPDSIAVDLDWFVANGYVKEKPDLKTVIDNQYVDYAIQRLGKYQK